MGATAELLLILGASIAFLGGMVWLSGRRDDQ